jgi:ADP-ribosylglycohydrolase
MRYSLLYRFQGALIGSAIAGVLANRFLAQQQTSRQWLTPRLSKFSQLSQADRLSALVLDKLINYGKLQAQDWQTILGQANNNGARSNFILATLPIALYCHENLSLLREQLELAQMTWQDASISLEDTLLFHQAIALILKEQLPTASLERIIERSAALKSPLTEKLQLVQTAIERGKSLEQAMAAIAHREPASKADPTEAIRSAIALSFYCFVCTPENFTLAVTRAVRTGSQIHLTASLTGALAGVYNSIHGLPLDWYLSDRHLFNHLSQQAQLLFASWAGVSTPQTSPILEEEAIAASSSIQPRASLKIISQKP